MRSHLDDWILEAERRVRYARALGQKATFSEACNSSFVGQLQQQCVLTVVCWMWHRGVVLQMTIGMVGYVWGEAVAPRPGWAGSWRLKENKMKDYCNSSSVQSIKEPLKCWKLDQLQAHSAVVYSDGISYCLIQGQAQGRLMMRQRWTPRQVAADLGARMPQWEVVGCWMVDAEWSAWSARCR